MRANFQRPFMSKMVFGLLTQGLDVTQKKHPKNPNETINNNVNLIVIHLSVRKNSLHLNY